jgi:hypothetical protein
MTVRKRNGQLEPINLEKILRAVTHPRFSTLMWRYGIVDRQWEAIAPGVCPSWEEKPIPRPSGCTLREQQRMMRLQTQH